MTPSDLHSSFENRAHKERGGVCAKPVICCNKRHKDGQIFHFSGSYYKISAQKKSNNLATNLNAVVTGETCKVTHVIGTRHTQCKELKETNDREMVMVLHNTRNI